MTSCIAVVVASLFGGGVLAAAEPPMLRVDASGRFLATQSGQPELILCDTAWRLVTRVSRQDTIAYLAKRRDQQFNAVTFVLYMPNSAGLANPVRNLDGDAPFKLVDGLADPTQPDVKPGPNDDYWDHVDWLVALTREMGFYAVILPTWGSGVVGGYDGKNQGDSVFNESNAYAYGHWLGKRFHNQPHIIWMLGGDRRAVYGPDDYRPVFRAMAQGLGAGVTAAGDIDAGEIDTAVTATGQPAGTADFGGLLMSYHSQKNSPQSSEWFHRDAWLSFNSIQEWPERQQGAIASDWQRSPPKPTWVFEPRYEGYWQKPYQATDWGDWQMRQQAWQSVLAGGFGFTYGHERVFGFGDDGWDWKRELGAPGANQMQHLVKAFQLWNKEDYASRIPDQSLLDGDQGKAERLESDRITATKNGAGTLAMIYSADGSDIRLKLQHLSGQAMTASWFNPRTGKWRVGDDEFNQPTTFANDLKVGSGAAVRRFAPPGGKAAGNDWLLILDAR